MMAKEPTTKKSSVKPTPKKTASPKTASKNAVVAKTPAKGKMKDAAKEQVSNLKTQASDAARSAASRGKERTGEAMDSISRLIRDSAATIDEKVGAQYGDYARNAADTVESWAGKVNTKEVDDILEDARSFVRKSPAIAIGAAAIIGFALVRLVKSGQDDA